MRPHRVPEGLLLDPTKSDGAIKAAYYSAAFLLRAELAKDRDMDPEEVDISGVRLIGDQAVGEIILNDVLPNGSGFTRWLKDEWPEMLRRTVEAGPGSFTGGVVEDEHVGSCDASCYRCLRNYRNMPFHSLLDWRLALNLLRVLANERFQCGLDGQFDTPDLARWPDQAMSLCDSFCTSFGFEMDLFGELPGFRTSSGAPVIIKHPLWDCDEGRRSGLLAEATEEAERSGKSARYLDMFNLLRRMSFCYQQIERPSTNGRPDPSVPPLRRVQ